MLHRVVPADGRSVKRLRFVPGVGVVSVGMDGRMVIADPERWAEVYVSVYVRVCWNHNIPKVFQISVKFHATMVAIVLIGSVSLFFTGTTWTHSCRNLHNGPCTTVREKRSTAAAHTMHMPGSAMSSPVPQIAMYVSL